LLETVPTALNKCVGFSRQQFQTIDPIHEIGWEGLISSHPACSFAHSAAWAQVLHETYAHRPRYIVLYAKRKVLALLPLMEVNSPVTGRRGVCLPFTDACLPLLDETVSQGTLFQAALDLGRQRAWRYLEIRGVRNLPKGARRSLGYIGHGLTLNQNEEEVFARFKPGVRQAVRKAHREGVECEIKRSFDSIRAFYGLQCQTRRRHGLPPQPFRFFENIFEFVLSKEMGFVVLARWRGMPVAGAVFFCLGRKAIFKYGASSYSFQHLRGNDLAMAEGIRWLCREGFEQLDFGRTSMDNEGLRRFKRGFGAEECQIDYVKYNFEKVEFVRDRDQTSGWFTHLFRRMPLPLSRLVGGLFYRHLS
jgi:CelD/BcsL family acetyltransferase involved in cellulose biosynthesis